MVNPREVDVYACLVRLDRRIDTIMWRMRSGLADHEAKSRMHRWLCERREYLLQHLLFTQRR